MPILNRFTGVDHHDNRARVSQPREEVETLNTSDDPEKTVSKTKL